MSAPAEASATGEALVQVGSAGIAASPRVSGEESSPQHPSQQAQPERELGSLCSSLAAAAAAANNDLREYLLQHADQRPSIVGLSRELVEVQTASRLYIRRCSVVDASAEDNAADSLPTRVIAHLITVVHETGRVVANIMNVLEASGMENGQGSAGAAADLAPRLSRATASTNICTAALNLGLDAMALYVLAGSFVSNGKANTVAGPLRYSPRLRRRRLRSCRATRRHSFCRTHSAFGCA